MIDGALGYSIKTDWRLLAGELLLLMILFARRLALGLAFAVFAIPLYFYHKEVGPAALPPAEVLTVVCVVAWLLRARPRGMRQHIPRPSGIDWAVLLFFSWSILSLAVSEDLTASLQELRLTIIGPTLLYLLLRNVPQSASDLLKLVDALVLAGLPVAVIGLYQYGVTGDVIEAEGVRRLRSVYYSPNHLALFLDRVLPLVMCVALLGTSRRRQALYGLASGVMLVALYLTFSRGAWLLGLPAAVLFIGSMRGRRATKIALAGIVLIVLMLIPILVDGCLSRRLTSFLSDGEQRVDHVPGAFRVVSAPGFAPPLFLSFLNPGTFCRLFHAPAKLSS